MRPAGFPFPALVGLDQLKLALQLAAIDRRLSVLIRGDKGAGKSTAARGLVDLLETGAPFINLPIGATEDRLLGGMDVERALKGEPVLKRGLLAEASGGVLYVDEVNLLADHLADALLDAVATGVHVVEREGFSATEAADFVLVGSMNPEEGALRPQLLDRFAFAVDVVAPMEPVVRRQVIERRLSYDADPSSFSSEWEAQRLQMGRQLDDARGRLGEIVVPGAMIEVIAARVAACGIRSLRADLAVVRGSRALAALQGVAVIDASHVEAVLPLVLAHRASSRSPEARQGGGPEMSSLQPDRSRSEGSAPQQDMDGRAHATRSERVFAPVSMPAPRLIIEHETNQPGRSSRIVANARGVVTGARRTPEPGELDTRATLLHAISRSGATALAAEDLHEQIRTPHAGTRYIFVIDSSGSHAVQDRMRLVKGAVSGLLGGAHGRGDEVVVIACRGGSAAVLVEPTGVLGEVQQALEYLPTGGRTPLAHALELAAAYVNDAAVVILLTDGHANVSTTGNDPWADALAAAAAIRCPALVIDSEDGAHATGNPRELASQMRATHVRLAELGDASVLHLIATAR